MSLGVYTLKFLRLSILLKPLLPVFETAPLILIPFPIFHEHQGRQGQGHKLRCRRGQPDAVYPPNHRQDQHGNQHGNQHEHEGMGEDEDREDDAVGQRGEHPIGKDMKANKEQHQGADSISGDRQIISDRQIINRIIRPGKNGHQGLCRSKGRGNSQKGNDSIYF